MSQHSAQFERTVLEKLDHFHTHLIRLSDQIDAVFSRQSENQEQIMSALTDALDQAEAAAAANSDADASAEALLVSLSKMVADLQSSSTEPATVARITALSNALASRAAQLGTAVAANTPAAPPAP